MTMFWVFSFFFPIIIYSFLALYLRVLKVYFMRLKLCPNFFIIIFVVVCDVFRREIIKLLRYCYNDCNVLSNYRV